MRTLNYEDGFLGEAELHLAQKKSLYGRARAMREIASDGHLSSPRALLKRHRVEFLVVPVDEEQGIIEHF